MLKNYYEINENESVGSFLKEVNDKKNSQYLILNTSPVSFIDIRTIALKAHSNLEKLKSLKKNITVSKSNEKKENLSLLIDSGDRVIKTNSDFFDFLDGLKLISESKYDFFLKSLADSASSEIFAVNEEDKISNARNYMINHKINLLPVIDKLKVIGEVRMIDFLVNNLFEKNSQNSNFKDARKIYDLPISNLVNKKPITLDVSNTYLDAINLMIEKKLPSIIITRKEELYSVISYRDIFKLIKKDAFRKNYLIEYVGSSNIFPDELDLVNDYAQRTMDKISKISNYDLLKISFKVHGNKDGTHKKKLSVNLLLSKGNKVIHMDCEMVPGTSDEEHNDKKWGTWNVAQMVQESLFNLKKKVKSSKF